MVMHNDYQEALARQESQSRTALTPEAFKRDLVDNLYYARGQGAYTASPHEVYLALAYTVRDYLVDRYRRTTKELVNAHSKFIYYLSAEYLPGRQITQNLLYTGTTELARQALAEMGLDLDELIALEPEPALGNGGLGRLAACFMDSLATLDLPSVAYGIHYEFEIFKQSFKDGWQLESPDQWLYSGNPWEFAHPDNQVNVGFGGTVEHLSSAGRRGPAHWTPGETLIGEPLHTLVPGFNTGMVNLLRLWRARASQEFNFQLFDVGDYARAAEQKIYSENITKVLYPNDNTPQGRELRLKQEYFFVACSIQDILRRFTSFNENWLTLPDKAVIQLNDTHPVLAIPELMRQLVDEHNLPWETAWGLTQKVFAYTCHTLMPEALEKWQAGLFERLLPRHMEIIYEINDDLLQEVCAHFQNDAAREVRMSIIEEGPERMIRMANLATAASFSVNGVAELHSELLKRSVLSDFYEFWPEKFNNKTNGVSARRFVRLANPRLSELVSSKIGSGWLNDLEQLRGLEPYAEDAGFWQAWREVKRQNKVDLAATILQATGTSVDPDSMFDVMVKRLHEYKRQLLKALHIITLYQRLKANPKLDLVPRTFIFGAKAAPGYQMAKLIIKLINSIAEVVNADPETGSKLKVAFLPNFNVTLGELIYPAADLSEQISLAGKEASGTGNMKFALNGALTIGTLDGANIEIRERVGAENFFLFGLTAHQVMPLKAAGYNPVDYYNRNPALKAAIDAISAGTFLNGDASLFQPIVNSLLGGDEYMLLADYPGYIQCQADVDRLYRDPENWTRRSILNTARCGYFSSDRAVSQYNEEIWKAQVVRVAL